jgi:hypothetical protein
MAFATRQIPIGRRVSQRASSVGPPQTDLSRVRQLVIRESKIAFAPASKKMFPHTIAIRSPFD